MHVCEKSLRFIDSLLYGKTDREVNMTSGIFFVYSDLLKMMKWLSELVSIFLSHLMQCKNGPILRIRSGDLHAGQCGLLRLSK